VEFRGTLGTLLMQEGSFEILPEKIRTQELPALSPLARKENAEQARATKQSSAAKVSRPGSADTAFHARNFLDCLKSRQTTACPVEVGHRSTTATLLARIALHRHRYLEWDPVQERITNDAEANRYLSYEYRAPWKLT
jgi:hypothetical protein